MNWRRNMDGNLKVLHVWNTAGVASTIAKFMDRLHGTESRVLMRASEDPFGLTYYGGPARRWGAKRFLLHAVLEARKYDIVHVHYYDRAVRFIKRLFPSQKVVLHYHGDDIRGAWEMKRERWEKADAILVSTPDLLTGAPPGVLYLPDPVDPELFHPIPEFRKLGTALHITYSRYEHSPDVRLANEWAKSERVELTVINRDSSPIPFTDMPGFLNRFEFYVDQIAIPSLSKTALEALACGLRVIDWRREEAPRSILSGHDPDEIGGRLFQVYKQII